MYETNVTVVGRLITPLKQWRFADGSMKVSGRMAGTERRFDRGTGQWIDGQTFYVGISCKRALAENAFTSLRVGDPLVVHGRLYSREYEKDGKPQTVTELEAWSIGPDLQWCTAVVTRRSRAAQAPPAAGVTADGGQDVPGSFAPTAAEGPDGHESVDPAWGAGGLVPQGDGSDVEADDMWGDRARSDEAAVGV